MHEQLLNAIEPYKENYIRKMRERIGHAPIMTTACGVIIVNDQGEILLQQRADNGCWGLPGGMMELGEKFVDAAGREVREEAGIEVANLRLFGIYSGEDRIIQYPNGDICCVTSIVFWTDAYNGEVQQKSDEALQHKFFWSDALPEEINGFDRRYLEDWLKRPDRAIVD